MALFALVGLLRLPRKDRTFGSIPLKRHVDFEREADPDHAPDND